MFSTYFVVYTIKIFNKINRFERNKISVKFYIRELIKNSWDIEEIIDDLQKIVILLN